MNKPYTVDLGEDQIVQDIEKMMEEIQKPNLRSMFVIPGPDFNTLKNDLWFALQKPLDAKPFAVEQAFAKYGLREVGELMAEHLVEPFAVCCSACEGELEPDCELVCDPCHKASIEDSHDDLEEARKNEREKIKESLEAAKDALDEIKID